LILTNFYITFYSQWVINFGIRMFTRWYFSKESIQTISWNVLRDMRVLSSIFRLTAAHNFRVNWEARLLSCSDWLLQIITLIFSARVSASWIFPLRLIKSIRTSGVINGGSFLRSLTTLASIHCDIILSNILTKFWNLTFMSVQS